MNHFKNNIVGAVSIFLMVVVLLPSTAMAISKARDIGAVDLKGTCSKGSPWTFKGGNTNNNGWLSVIYKINTGQVGQNWHIVMTDQGITQWDTLTTTANIDGLVAAQILHPNYPGVDNVVGHAENLDNGETCDIQANF